MYLRKYTALFALLLLVISLEGQTNAKPFVISTGWQLQDASKTDQPGEKISSASFQAKGWYNATVPGTILTSLVNNGVYPEPLWGENNRPDKIPESLSRTSYWYRTSFVIPNDYKGKKIWLNFAGINYSAKVYVNGKEIGNIQGAFIRGTFDISEVAKPGSEAILAVLVSPQPNPGTPHEHTIALGMGLNGGITASDGPTFLCSLGWDWIPAIRDRNTGIWQKVFISASGDVLIKSPLITTDLPLPKLNSADISIQTTLENVSDQSEAIIVNRAFINRVGMKDPLDKIVTVHDKKRHIVGIIENHVDNLYRSKDPEPFVFYPAEPKEYKMMQVRAEASDLAGVKQYLEEAWKKLYPTKSFESRFQDEIVLGNIQRVNGNLKKIFLFLTVLGGLLSASGIFSLASLNIAKRTKEIGIRKALGATVSNVVLLLNREFVIILTLAGVVGAVGGFYLTNALLDVIYKYHISIQIVSVVICAAIIFAIGIFTTSVTILKAAKANPVDTLRNE